MSAKGATISDGKTTAERRDTELPFPHHVKGYANVMVKTGLKVS